MKTLESYIKEDFKISHDTTFDKDFVEPVETMLIPLTNSSDTHTHIQIYTYYSKDSRHGRGIYTSVSFVKVREGNGYRSITQALFDSNSFTIKVCELNRKNDKKMQFYLEKIAKVAKKVAKYMDDCNREAAIATLQAAVYD